MSEDTTAPEGLTQTLPRWAQPYASALTSPDEAYQVFDLTFRGSWSEGDRHLMRRAAATLAALATPEAPPTEELCGTCGGTPHASGLICVCGGAGTQQAEIQGLREALFHAQRQLGCYPNLPPLAPPATGGEQTKALEVAIRAAYRHGYARGHAAETTYDPEGAAEAYIQVLPAPTRALLATLAPAAGGERERALAQLADRLLGNPHHIETMDLLPDSEEFAPIRQVKYTLGELRMVRAALAATPAPVDAKRAAFEAGRTEGEASGYARGLFHDAGQGTLEPDEEVLCTKCRRWSKPTLQGAVLMCGTPGCSYAVTRSITRPAPAPLGYGDARAREEAAAYFDGEGARHERNERSVGGHDPQMVAAFKAGERTLAARFRLAAAALRSRGPEPRVALREALRERLEYVATSGEEWFDYVVKMHPHEARAALAALSTGTGDKE